ncbi:uncharacterized protein [Anoplolepis gracilipes]|uniref:uncharacterized protein n=1 Tax=Anoplolepis gracilipes TaxID=354296 RepID=UPI003BA22EA8
MKISILIFCLIVIFGSVSCQIYSERNLIEPSAADGKQDTNYLNVKPLERSLLRYKRAHNILPSISDILSPGKSKLISSDVSKIISPNVSQIPPPNMPELLPPSDMTKLIPSDISQLIPSDISKILPMNMSQLIPSDISKILPLDKLIFGFLNNNIMKTIFSLVKFITSDLCPTEKVSIDFNIQNLMSKPSQTIKNTFCYFFNTFGKEGLNLLKKGFDTFVKPLLPFIKIFLPQLHKVLNQLMGTGLMPPSVVLIIQIFNGFYYLLKMFGYV